MRENAADSAYVCFFCLNFCTDSGAAYTAIGDCSVSIVTSSADSSDYEQRGFCGVICSGFQHAIIVFTSADRRVAKATDDSGKRTE